MCHEKSGSTECMSRGQKGVGRRNGDGKMRKNNGKMRKVQKNAGRYGKMRKSAENGEDKMLEDKRMDAMSRKTD
jgi:hypothetical protein